MARDSLVVHPVQVVQEAQEVQEELDRDIVVVRAEDDREVRHLVLEVLAGQVHHREHHLCLVHPEVHQVQVVLAGMCSTEPLLDGWHESARRVHLLLQQVPFRPFRATYLANDSYNILPHPIISSLMHLCKGRLSKFIHLHLLASSSNSSFAAYKSTMKTM